ncbi:hypothetical protein [Garciella nitratireducens]|uniref:Uncharacterized protein n=1 Tax=Garciella nitratireducens DSM 15102 TaxID=1121911 RepID=A0A1T4JX86_9FIRM|nr:hypothetical protein [Garciella nitratireducens]RBP41156.1 hypothetical protein DFR81_11152 [Garciella nitratireducens]SJZ34717.1 hypothetical protein SAMN02745973_00178 [Garciella nitratireducens DSM 15102]
MNVQVILGLPLEIGMKFINKDIYDIKIIETFPLSKQKKSIQSLEKNPYILRIRETDNNSLELLVSYF